MIYPPTYLEIVEKMGDSNEANIVPLPDHAIIYPPVGFLPWVVCSIGNGDDYGYYWAIGKEHAEPIVAQMSHDCWALNPIASSIEALVRLGTCPDLESLLTTGTNPANEDADDGEEYDEDEDNFPDVAERLTMDDRSPFLLTANADVALSRNNLQTAESLYAKAIAILPEYTAALYGMAVLNRRLRRPAEVIRWMLEVIRSPLCFRGASFWSETFLPPENLNRNDYRRKCLHWLQQARPEHSEAVSDDPLFRIRHHLTFASGVASNDDYRLYDEAIEVYLQQGRGIEAIKLAMIYGELMMGETISFRERYEFSLPRHQQRLLQLFREAKLESRARLLE